MIRRHVLTLIVAALLALAAGLAVTRLRVDTSLASLFDDSDPAAIALVRVLDHFPSAEELLLLVESPLTEAPQPERLLAFAARLDEAVKSDPAASQLSGGVTYRVDAQTRKFFEEVLVPNGLFYLDDDSFQAAQHRLTRAEMAKQIRRNEQMMATPGPAADALAKVILKDPLHLHEFLIDRVGAGRPFKTYQGSDAFLGPDGRALLIRIRGKGPVSDLEFSKAFTARIRALANGVNTDGLAVNVSGAYAIAAASERAIRGDMIGSVVSSVILLQLLFIVSHRRPVRSFVLAFIPVAIGTLYGFGMYAALANALTPLTAVIGGMLAGMSIDYSIEFLSYYHARRTVGDDPRLAAADARRSVGWAITAAWATSVAGFAAIAFSHVKALRDFALLGALGLTGAFLCALFLLPPMLVLVDRSKARRDASTRWRPVRTVLAQVARFPRTVVLVMSTILVFAVGVLALPGPILPLEPDLSVMHPRPNQPLDTQQRIADRLGASPGTLVIHQSADNDRELLHLAHDVDQRLRGARVRDAGAVGSFGLATLLPNPAIAAKRLAATEPGLPEQVLSDFRAVIAESLFEPAAYRDYASFLRRLLTPTSPPVIDDLRRYPSLAENILPSADADASAEAITLVFLREDNQNREARDAVVSAIRAALIDVKGGTLTGMPVLSHDTEHAIRRDLPRLMLVAMVIVALYLVVYFRSVLDCLLALLPTIFSVICLLAFMRLTGQKLNMLNLVAFPLLIGIDVDYGIFLVSAARRHAGESAEQVVDQLAIAASAVMLCAGTTALGFGSLTLTSVPAVQSLGWVVAVGVTACAAGALLLTAPLTLLLARTKA